MSERCLHCGTILIREARLRSDDGARPPSDIGGRNYTIVGSVAGLLLGMASWFIMSRSESTFKTWLTVCTLAGSAIGRYITWKERNTL
ncbi:hypothetical protein INH39_32360 [Massilia violaceinigra]|uniref:Uncharacterized protein n=1 Tax=Massilia violaceinigra TaxID=2045208 RepID=A0ABY4A7K9_9BURK|nr:hypothetical protein [Massilia violaceinigra]UOD29994.1 hypothetical protein INH39_32360 [Massilia violaceinigra]